MPHKQTFKLPPLNLGSETLGQRIAKLRKSKGFTQSDLAIELAQGKPTEREIRNIRVLISDYERNRLRPNYEMIIRLSIALEVTADELLGIKQLKTKVPNLKIQKRVKKIETLPDRQQKFILKAIDSHLKALEK